MSSLVVKRLLNIVAMLRYLKYSPKCGSCLASTIALTFVIPHVYVCKKMYGAPIDHLNLGSTET